MALEGGEKSVNLKAVMRRRVDVNHSLISGGEEESGTIRWTRSRNHSRRINFGVFVL